MKLEEAAAAGIARVRLPQWANPDAYLKLDLMADGKMGPWLHLYDRRSQEVIDEPTPQNVIGAWQTRGDDDFEEYKGPIDQAEPKEVKP